ncbi:MAG: PDZ domain-containing protein [Deltaproteobacteria bacterium]|nr:PDZ domain-containing protein [Deltaproteobacteria bacterium]MBW1912775.1 PDZ domain-containing protein [Deltaproteobacteria bacterium]
MTKTYNILFNLLVLSVILYTGADIFYRIVRAQLSQVDTGKIVMQEVREDRRDIRPPLKDFQAIMEREIFGPIQKPAEKDTAGIEALEPTKLKIALLGTVIDNLENDVAVIEETDKRRQGLYRVGDSVQNAVIKMILRGKVVLRVGDRDEVLTMEESASSRAKSKDKIVKRPSSRTATERTITVRRSDIDRSLENINNLLSQARILPHLKDGRPDGLSITGIKSGSIYRKMGLRNGDIIYGVNGSPITTPEDILSMYNDLSSGTGISLQIKRSGRERTFNYKIR